MVNLDHSACSKPWKMALLYALPGLGNEFKLQFHLNENFIFNFRKCDEGIYLGSIIFYTVVKGVVRVATVVKFTGCDITLFKHFAHCRNPSRKWFHLCKY